MTYIKSKWVLNSLTAERCSQCSLVILGEIVYKSLIPGGPFNWIATADIDYPTCKCKGSEQ